MVQEKYYLYLDESGEFWENDPSKSSSLVGGVLCKKEQTVDIFAGKVHSNVVQSFLKDYPQYKDRNVNFNHATDAVKELKTDGPELKLRMVEATVGAGYIPVVFQQKGKHFIQTNTTTYIMFLVDGLIKLIQDRKIEQLTVVVGERLNLDLKAKWMRENPGVSDKAYKGPYIKKDDIKSEFQKFMSFAKIREAYAFGDLDPKVTFDMGDDKKNRLLILSDFVCNTYFTGDSFHNPREKSRFQKLKRTNRGERTPDKKYQVYSITETKEAEKLKRYIDDGNYSEALFFCMTVDIDDEEFDRAKNELTNLLSKVKGNEKKHILDILYSKIGKLLDVERRLQDTIKIIDNILVYFNEKLIWTKGEEVLKNRFFANLYLYKMAALTHMGEVKRFKSAADKCEHFVKETKDIDFYLMFENRWVVTLQDLFQYEDSISRGKKVMSIIQKFTAEDRGFDFTFNAFIDQLPKIANSLALTEYFTLNITHKYLNEARGYSDLAIKRFEGKENEIVRAYQNRAQIEAEVGNFSDAIQYLNKGLHIDFENLSNEQIKRLDQFGWYHMSKIIERMVQSTDVSYQNLGKKVLVNCLAGFKDYAKYFTENLKKSEPHPGYVSFTMMGSAMVNSGEIYLRDAGFEYLQQAYKFIEDTKSPTFKMHSIVILFRMLAVCSSDFNKKLIPDIKEKINRNVSFLIGFSDFSNSTPVMKELKKLCSQPFDKKAIEKGTRLVLM